MPPSQGYVLRVPCAPQGHHLFFISLVCFVPFVVHPLCGKPTLYQVYGYASPIFRYNSFDMKNKFPTEQIETELQASYQFKEKGEGGKSRVCARKAAGLALRYWLQSTQPTHAVISPFKAIELFFTQPGIPTEIHTASAYLLQKVDTDYHFPEEIDLIQEAQKLINFVKSQSED